MKLRENKINFTKIVKNQIISVYGIYAKKRKNNLMCT